MSDTPHEVPPALTPKQFLERAQSLKGVDAWIEQQLEQPDVTERSMLKTFVFLLHAIGMSMPFDDVTGLDAVRYDAGTSQALPSWRDCIGAIYGLKFSKAAEQPDG